MKHINIFLLVVCATLLNAATYWNLSWTGTGKLENGAVKVDDPSTKGANFLISDPFGADFTRAFKCSVEARCSGVVSGRTQAYLLVYDSNDNRLADYGTQSISNNTDWTKLAVEVSADKWPANSDHCRIMLQPAAGPLDGVGTAWFRKLVFGSKATAPEIPGDDVTTMYMFKRNGVNILNGEIKNFPFENAPLECRMEIMCMEASFAEAVQLLTDDEELGTQVMVAPWIDYDECFAPMQPLELTRIPGGYQADLRSLGAWRRLAVVFPGKETISLDNVKISRVEFAEDNWNAYWIWFTRDRVESINVCLRHEFELDEVPVTAMFQCAFDDGGSVEINGIHHRIGNGRFDPPDDDVASKLRVGKNVIAVKVHQARYAAGFLGELDMTFADGTSRKLITDHDWKYFPSDAEIRRESAGEIKAVQPPKGWNVAGFDDSAWGKCVEIARPPQNWGKVLYRVHSPRVPITLLSGELPTSMQAGEGFSSMLTFSAEKPFEGNVPVRGILSRNGVKFLEWTAGYIPAGTTEASVLFSFHLSEYIKPGEYDLTLSTPGFTAVTQDGVACASTKLAIANERTAETADARLRRDQFGVPTLYIDGKPFASIFSARYSDPIATHAAQFGTAEEHLYHAYLTPSWPEPNTPDYTNMDALAEKFLQGDPKARLVIKMELRDGKPAWYLPMYPEDAIVFDGGKAGGHISLASMRWRALVADYLKGLIAHVKASPYADRIIGYMPCEGEEGQWMHYWSGDDPARDGALSDYSKPMLEYFRKWLKRTYGTDEALQQAWNDDTVTIDTATIPDGKTRCAGEGAFRLLPRDRKSADFGWALSDVVSEGIDFYGKIIKEETDGKAITGALYGHLMDLGSGWLGEQVGYARQRLAIETPYIDYYLGPISYSHRFRDVGYPGGYDMPSPGSLELHDKIWINENDLRTHLNFPAEYAYSVRTPADTTQILAREYARALCLRSGYYLYALGQDVNWFDDPETMATIASLREEGKKCVTMDRSSTSEIAAFFDDDTQCRMNLTTPGVSLNGKAIFQREALFRIGGTVDEFLQFDIANPNLKPYKFYAFLNPYFVKEDEQKAIRSIAANQDVRVLFCFTPGIAGDNGLTTETAAALTGMTFEILPEGKELSLRTSREFAGLPAGSAFGGEGRLAPLAVPSGYDEILAEFADGTPAVVRKGNIYVSCIADLPVQMVREIAKSAGCYLYSEDDIAVFACSELAAFHTERKQKACAFRAPEGKLLQEIWPEAAATPQKEIRWMNTSPITKIYRLVEEESAD
ncbi:MAG: alpha-L-rhamnosidase N-terminal domain-containing protein [Lentisphaeria bacterium]|nr:alpha-L-rhamnosidase N-terminal domain-containing protein [Lentisphaeria bacterium]